MPKIFINPGHGGNDSGAVGFGLREADVALNIGKLVDRYLRAVGFDTLLFQYDGLQTICNEANNYKPDFFVSIHQIFAADTPCFSCGEEPRPSSLLNKFFVLKLALIFYS